MNPIITTSPDLSTPPATVYNEANNNVSIVLSISADSTSTPPDETLYSFTDVSILPSNVASLFSITYSSLNSVATLYAASLSGSVPIIHIKYRKGSDFITAYDWNSVPPNSQIFDYLKSTGPITVTISYSWKGVLTGQPDTTGSGSLTFTITGDFSSGITYLRSKLNNTSDIN